MMNAIAKGQVTIDEYVVRYDHGTAFLTSPRGGKCLLPDDFVRIFLKGGGHPKDLFTSLRVADEYDLCVEHYGDWTATLEQELALSFRRLLARHYKEKCKLIAACSKGGKNGRASIYRKAKFVAIAREIRAKNASLSNSRIAELTLDHVAENGILKGAQKEPSSRQLIRWMKKDEDS